MPSPRVPFATIAVSGLGVFVAVAIGVTLWLSGAASVRTTQTLLAAQAETLVDNVERRMDALLEPVNAQSSWILNAFADGSATTSGGATLDAFMLGALGAAPRVATLALIQTSGTVRRWSRARGIVPAEDWSARPNIVDTVMHGQQQRGPEWRPPLWGQVSGAPVLLHVSPLRRAGVYLGVLVQVVPVAQLSEELALFSRESGVTPFVLLGADRVLAHPSLVGEALRAHGPGNPLPKVAEFGDPVLTAIRGPDTSLPMALGGLRRATAVSARVGNDRYLALTRTIDRYGAEPWTVGAYVGGANSVQATEMRRLLVSLGAGVGVLLVAVLFAAWAGRRLSRPVQALAEAARAVEEGELEAVPTLAGSRIIEFDEASRSFNRMVVRLRESRVIRRTLGRFVSKEVARRLMRAGGRLEPVECEASVLFCDIEGFTRLTESLGPAGVVAFLNAYFEVMVGIVERHEGLITQFQGDAILAVFNVPIENANHADNAVLAAAEMVAATQDRDFAGQRALNRVGVSTGPLVAGAVGARGRLTYTVHGNVVNLASRLEALNKAYGTRVLVSGETAARCTALRLRKVADAIVRGRRGTMAVYTLDASEAADPDSSTGVAERMVS